MDKLGLMIEISKYIVFICGKGVSIESGLSGKREDELDGKILTDSFLKENPEEFYEYYKEKFLKEELYPNAAHKKLREMEDKGKIKAIITSNEDSLLQKSGCKNVLALNGSVVKNYCTVCYKEYNEEYVKNSDGTPKCSCGGIIKPGIVLYDEALDEGVASEAIEHIKNADLLIVAGTSLMSYPASGLLRYFHGQYLALINEEETIVDKIANFVSHEKISDVMGRLEINTEK